MEFALNVLASLTASVLFIVAMGMLSRRARWILTGILGRILDVDIEFVFSNKSDAVTDLQREIRRANKVFVFASRGNELQREAFTSIFHERQKKRNVEVRILLPATTLSANEYDWTAQRDRELGVFDASYGNGLLRSQIQTNVDFLNVYIQSNDAQLRRYNSPHVGRLIITERFVYFTPYLADLHGSESRVYKYRCGGDTYQNFVRLFNQLWEADINSSSTKLAGP